HLLGMINQDRPVTLRTNLVSGEADLIEGLALESELPRREGALFIEPFRRPAHLVIVGAIHIAIPPHRLAKLMGYRVAVIDARAKFATGERFPEADELIVAWPDEALAKIPIDESTYIVVLTHDPKFDLPALRSVLKKDAGYIGAIGSRKTNQNRFDALRKEGFTEEQLARVHGPIGLDLGGRGAEETALGILAEITAVRFGGSGVSMRAAPPALPPRRVPRHLPTSGEEKATSPRMGRPGLERNVHRRIHERPAVAWVPRHSRGLRFLLHDGQALRRRSWQPRRVGAHGHDGRLHRRSADALAACRRERQADR